MNLLKDSKAYETIQNSVESNFSFFINKKKENIHNIVIIGAYHGYEVTRMYNTYSNCTFHCFEANPQNFNVLKNKHKDKNRVICYPFGISHSSGTKTFYEVSTPGNGSLLKFKEDGINKIIENIQITCKRLDDVFNINIDLLWVDTQGTELDVLKSYDLKKIDSLFLEVTTDPKKTPYEGNTLLSELEIYLKDTHYLYSLGLDNINKNGIGNSFWISKIFI